MTIDRKKIYQGLDVRGGVTTEDSSIFRGRVEVTGIFDNDQFFPLTEIDTSTDTVLTVISPNGGIIVPSSISGTESTGQLIITGLGSITPSPTNTEVKLGVTREANSIAVFTLNIASVNGNDNFAAAIITALTDVSNPDTADFRADYNVSVTNNVITVTANNFGVRFNGSLTALTVPLSITVTPSNLIGGTDGITTSNTSGLTKYYINRTIGTLNVTRSEAFPTTSWGEWFSGSGGTPGNVCTIAQDLAVTAQFNTTLPGVRTELAWDETNTGFTLLLDSTNKRMTSICGYTLTPPLPITFAASAPMISGDLIVKVIHEDGSSRDVTVTETSQNEQTTVISNATLVNPGIVPGSDSVISLEIRVATPDGTDSVALSTTLTYTPPAFLVTPFVTQGILRFDEQFTNITISRSQAAIDGHFPTGYVNPSTLGSQSFVPGGRTILSYFATLGTALDRNTIAAELVLRETALYTNPTDTSQPQVSIVGTNSIIPDFRFPIIALSVTPGQRQNITTAILNAYVQPTNEPLYANIQALTSLSDLLEVPWPSEASDRTVKIFAIPNSFRRAGQAVTINYFTTSAGGLPTPMEFFTTVDFGADGRRVSYDVYQAAISQPGPVNYFLEFRS